MPEKEDVQYTRDDNTQCSDDPDDEREQHGEVDNSLLFVAIFDHSLNVHEELLESGAILRCMLANWKELSLHDGVQSHRVDRNTRALGDNNDKSTLELEINKEGNVVGTLLTFRQLGEDQETAPSSTAAGEPHTLPNGSHWFKIAFCHTAGAHDTECPNASIDQEDVGDDDGNGEDPLGDFERHLRLYLTGPLVKGKEVHGGEGIGGIDGARDEDEDPKPGVGEGCQA